MTIPLPALRGSLSQLQRAVAKFYFQLQQRFEGNVLVSSMWAAMGNDLQEQVESLSKLPPSFWQSLTKQEKVLSNAVELIPPLNGENLAGSLRSHLTRTVDIEEPIILNVYARLIRPLRVEWTELALDFYVEVKAHLARVARSIQLYSGDPALIQRCAVLLQSFEKGVQGPAIIEEIPVRPSRKKAAQPRHGGKATSRARGHASIKEAHVQSLDKISKRAKPRVQQIDISRRQAQR
jgi:hypothetical protein